jgi:DNA-binding NtrC family response regulator
LAEAIVFVTLLHKVAGGKMVSEPMRVLLVEDDDHTHGMIRAVLKDVDPSIDVEIVINGYDALNRYVKNGFYDLVIMDNAHPGLFGTELIEAILRINPLQPIILQTGNAGDHIGAFKQKHPNIPFLGKPYPLQQLRDFASAALHQRDARLTDQPGLSV